MIDLCTKCDFKFLDCLEHKCAQLCIEIVEIQRIFKSAVGFEHMKNLIRFHRTQILYEPEITDFAEEFSRECLIIKL